MSNKRINLKPIAIDDLRLVKKWEMEPHIKRWWRKEWSVKKNSELQVEEGICSGKKSSIIEVEGQKIGFIHVYSVTGMQRNSINPCDVGIRFFIGKKEFLNQNLGSAAVYAMVESLFEEQEIERIIAEPQADNWSAIISLQRARFRSRGRINRPGFNLVQLTFARNFLIKMMRRPHTTAYRRIRVITEKIIL